MSDELIKKELLVIRNKFLCCVPIKDLRLEETIKNLSWDQQEFLINETLKNPLLEKYPIKFSYRKQFLKLLIGIFERNDLEINDLVYDSLGEIINLDDTEKYYYKHYCVEGAFITLKENINYISEGTTGLCSWQASLALAEWVIANKRKFDRKILLELGSGVGLVGITAAQYCEAAEIYLSDCHPEVLTVLVDNVDLNITSTLTFDNTIVDREPILEDLVPNDCDVIGSYILDNNIDTTIKDSITDSSTVESKIVTVGANKLRLVRVDSSLRNLNILQETDEDTTAAIKETITDDIVDLSPKIPATIKDTTCTSQNSTITNENTVKEAITDDIVDLSPKIPATIKDTTCTSLNSVITDENTVKEAITDDIIDLSPTISDTICIPLNSTITKENNIKEAIKETVKDLVLHGNIENIKIIEDPICLPINIVSTNENTVKETFEISFLTDTLENVKYIQDIICTIINNVLINENNVEGAIKETVKDSLLNDSTEKVNIIKDTSCTPKISELTNGNTIKEAIKETVKDSLLNGSTEKVNIIKDTSCTPKISELTNGNTIKEAIKEAVKDNTVNNGIEIASFIQESVKDDIITSTEETIKETIKDSSIPSENTVKKLLKVNLSDLIESGIDDTIIDTTETVSDYKETVKDVLVLNSDQYGSTIGDTIKDSPRSGVDSSVLVTDACIGSNFAETIKDSSRAGSDSSVVTSSVPETVTHAGRGDGRVTQSIDSVNFVNGLSKTKLKFEVPLDKASSKFDETFYQDLNQIFGTYTVRTEVAVASLPWQVIRQNRYKLNIVPDIVLAADVVYDSSVFKHLCRAIKYFLHLNKKCEIVFACTERNGDTLAEFLKLLEQKRLIAEELPAPEPKYFFWSTEIPIRFFKISPRSAPGK